MSRLILVLLCLLAPEFCRSDFRYSFTDLGPLNSRYENELTSWSINDDGQVLGFQEALSLPVPPTSHPTGGGGFVWVDQNGNGFLDADYVEPGTIFNTNIREMRYVGAQPGQPATRVMSLNAAGTIGGLTYTGDAIRLTRWISDDGVWPPEAGETMTGPDGAGGVELNRHGDMLDRIRAVLWRGDGQVLNLKERYKTDAAAEAGYLVSALDLNDLGEILVAGSRPDDDISTYSIWRPGSAPHDTGVQALGVGALNNSGQMAVMSLRRVEIAPGFEVNLPNVIVWDRASGELESFGLSLTGFHLNDHGQLVGYQTVSGGLATVAKVWDRQNGLRDLQPLIDNADDLELTHALDINNFGEIVAIGRRSGVPHAIVLRPRLGLDRWWATAGAPGIDITWTARLEGTPGVPQRATLDVISADPDGWDWAETSVVLRSNGWNREQTMGRLGLGDDFTPLPLGQLLPGTFSFQLKGIVPPAAPRVDLVAFHLAGEESETRLKAWFVADHPDENAFSNLVEIFAPVLFTHLNEPLGFPISVDSTWGPTGHPYDGNPSWCGGVPISGDSTAAMNLSRFDTPRHPNPRCSQWSGGHFTPAPSERIYAATVRKGRQLAINYYFHFAMSNWRTYGGANTHEGDWEGITVFLEERDEPSVWTPIEVAYAQHVRFAEAPNRWDTDGGQRIPWARVTRDPGGQRPHVYVGLGGHASYPHSGRTCWLGLDRSGYNAEAHDGMVRIDSAPVEYLPRVGGLDPADPSYQWLRFPGRWGRQLGLGKNGPPGPVFLEAGTILAVLAEQPVGQRWLDPWAWAAGMDDVLGTVCSVWPDFDLPSWIPLGGARVAPDEMGGTLAELVEAADGAALVRDVEVPMERAGLSFDYQFLDPGHGESLALKINGVSVWETLADTSVSPGLRPTGIIDLSIFAGEIITMELKLESAGENNARARVDNLIFATTPVSAPVVSAISVTGGEIRITWYGRVKRRYQVQVTSDLSDGEWHPLGAPVEATHILTSAIDPQPASDRFYRIQELPEAQSQ